jgi:2-polyprenyl-3-methyl-5-hydroxy-6-metoxy-1,4-benzoquinol methylase
VKEMKQKFDTCDLCDRKTFLRLPRFITKGLSITVCSTCGLIATNPKWNDEEITKIYDEDFDSDPSKKSKDAESFQPYFDKSKIQAQRYLLPLVKKFNLGKRWLEVRIRTGAFVEELVKQGFNVYGLDIVAENVERTNQKLKSDKFFITKPYSLLSPVLGLEKFDIISCLTVHILAHIPSPTTFPQQAYGKLNDGGFLFIDEKDVTKVPKSPHHFPFTPEKGSV